VTGVVRLKLYKGNIIIVGRKSPKSLYDPQIATRLLPPHMTKAIRRVHPAERATVKSSCCFENKTQGRLNFAQDRLSIAQFFWRVSPRRSS
jgi:hypothetical protein